MVEQKKDESRTGEPVLSPEPRATASADKRTTRRREVMEAFAIVKEVAAWSLTYTPTWEEYRAKVNWCRDLAERLDRP